MIEFERLIKIECINCGHFTHDCECKRHKKKTAKELILDFLAMADYPVALHEITIPGISQTSASARLREMKREGLVESHRVEGKRYTAWTAVPVVDIDWNNKA